jgi:hypothetical protein
MSTASQAEQSSSSHAREHELHFIENNCVLLSIEDSPQRLCQL